MPSISTSSHPSQPEEVIPPLDAPIPDTASDRPPTELILKVRLHTHDSFHLSHTNQKPAPNRNDLPLPALVLGCATFGFNIYAEQSACLGPEPVRVVRYALRAGINAFDTCGSPDHTIPTFPPSPPPSPLFPSVEIPPPPLPPPPSSSSIPLRCDELNE